MHGTPPQLDAGLRELGYDGFLPGQREAIETLLTERRLLLVEYIRKLITEHGEKGVVFTQR